METSAATAASCSSSLNGFGVTRALGKGSRTSSTLGGVGCLVDGAGHSMLLKQQRQ